MQKSKAVKCNGKTWVALELTPNEIDKLYDESATGSTSMVDAMLDVHDLNLVLMSAMFSMSKEEMEGELGNTSPSEYAKMIDAAREVNPDFFAMARQRRKLAGQIEAIDRILALGSESASASLSSTDTTGPETTA